MSDGQSWAAETAKEESWAECEADTLQRLATALLDHGDGYSNVEKAKFQNHANILIGIEREFEERQTVRH